MEEEIHKMKKPLFHFARLGYVIDHIQSIDTSPHVNKLCVVFQMRLVDKRKINLQQERTMALLEGRETVESRMLAAREELKQIAAADGGEKLLGGRARKEPLLLEQKEVEDHRMFNVLGTTRPGGDEPQLQIGDGGGHRGSSTGAGNSSTPPAAESGRTYLDKLPQTGDEIDRDLAEKLVKTLTGRVLRRSDSTKHCENLVERVRGVTTVNQEPKKPKFKRRFLIK